MTNEKHGIVANLRRLPAVDELLQRVDLQGTSLPRPLAVEVVRSLIASVRRNVQEGTAAPELQEWDELLCSALSRAERELFGRVINATGVVLHTNLGRAPLGQTAISVLAEVAGGYCSLEYDVEQGRRGSRHVHCCGLLNLLTGAEAAMVVNNGAAAILLALSSLTAGKDVIVSRGELVEIGGSFRVPEIMQQSGCRLVEVGTTNRTRLQDYEDAMTPDTGAILKVHPSNYRVMGFTSTVSRDDLAELARGYGISLVEDLGSGAFMDTAAFGLAHEPTVREAVAGGADIVTCSGDKLLGGPQSGLILGRKDLVQRCQVHPLARALRVGKLTLAALQATLLHYLRAEAENQVPIWRMCALSAESIGERAALLAERLQVRTCMSVQVELIAGESAVGGGSLPGEVLPTVLLAIYGEGRWSPVALANRLRHHRPPVIARIEDGRLLLDLRTVSPADDDTVWAALQAALAE